MTRSLCCEAVDRTAAFDACFERSNSGAEALLALVDLVGFLAADFVDAATRLGFERMTLLFAAALRLETLATFAALAAAFFAGRTGLVILAETFASLLLLVELDLDDRFIAFAGRLDDFFGAFFRVDMADLLLKPSASGMR